MERRALLGTAAVGIVGAAGCLGLSNPAENLGVPANESDCPEVGDRVVCVPETDPDSASVAMTAHPRSGSLPTTFEFTLTNGSGQTLSTNFYAWRLWKRVDGEWHHIVPDVAPQPLMRLDAGSTHEWELTGEHEQPAEPGRDYASWKSAGTVGGLGGGEYAFTIDGWFGDDPEETVGFGVLFEIDASELTLEPTTRVSDASRDGEVVTVHGEGHGDEHHRAEFVLRRVDEGTSSGSRTSSDDAADPQQIIAEQAAHDYRLRNTLSYLEKGVERVRYVEENHAITPVFGADEPYVISYRGELYEASASELGAETETS